MFFNSGKSLLFFNVELKDFRSAGCENPVKALIDNYCKGLKLLCLDEFQV
jgi:predicted ATPase